METQANLEKGRIAAFGAGLEITRLFHEARTGRQIAEARYYANQAMARAREAGLTKEQISEGIQRGREAFFRSRESPTERASRV